MKQLTFLTFVLLSLQCVCSQAQGSGPHYFVSDPMDSDQYYWRVKQRFGGVTVLQNYNLLATLLGDSPVAPKGYSLVPAENYDYGGTSPVRIQPFVYYQSSESKRGLYPGSELKRFLSDPLKGGRFNLSLPFKDDNVALSDRSALLRTLDGAANDRVWHVAIDFDYNGQTSRGFDVTAPADGVVIGQTGSSLAIKHRATNGREFLTIYQHLDAGSVPQGLKSVKRGQFIGRIETPGGYAHLHFGVAVKGPWGKIDGVSVPGLWYLIDPFGVYDYRRNRNSLSTYNYLPNNRLDRPVRGIKHAYVFMTNPPIGSLLHNEDCVTFSASHLEIVNSSPVRMISGRSSLFSFPTSSEAITALDIIQHYNMDKSCFVGRPNPDFSYLLVNNVSPRAGYSGEDCIGFSPGGLKIVRGNGSSFILKSGSTALFSFSNIREAGSAMTYILKYGFTKTCFVGRPDPSFQYLRK